MLNHRMTRPPVPQTGYGRLDAFGPNPGEQRHGVGNRMGCGLGPLPFVPSVSHLRLRAPCRKLLPEKRSPGQKARRLKEPIPLKRFAPTGKRPHRVSLSFIFRIIGSTPVPRHVRKQHAEAAEPGNPGEDEPCADKGGQPEKRMPEGAADDADEHQGTGRDLNLAEQRDG